MRRIGVSAARERLADVVAHVATRRERVLLTRHGRPLGALVPLEDVERLRDLDRAEMATDTPTLSAYRATWKRLTETIHRSS